MSAETIQLNDKLKQILSSYQYDKSFLVSILQDVQAEFRYLPEEALEEVSRLLELPLSQVYSVATFFRDFTLKQVGRLLILSCMDTAC
ncbi:MAG: NAD(P)H-dependent oxidoreductase subunit E, partial [Chloroflexi bacterium]|nr:NAD(P)H-dependent oxidoreductase subunit E [Chloroflexota bacterium]